MIRDGLSAWRARLDLAPSGLGVCGHLDKPAGACQKFWQSQQLPLGKKSTAGQRVAGQQPVVHGTGGLQLRFDVPVICSYSIKRVVKCFISFFFTDPFQGLCISVSLK